MSCEWFYSLRIQRKVFFSPQESREGSNVEMTVELKLACFPVYSTPVRNFNLKFSFLASCQTVVGAFIYNKEFGGLLNRSGYRYRWEGPQS